MVIFTILVSVLAPVQASPVPNPNCKIIFRHNDDTRADTETVVIRALADQKQGACTGRTLQKEDAVAPCLPLTPRDVERINRRLFLQGIPRDTTLTAEEVNAQPEMTVAGLADRIMGSWDKLYCKNGEYR